LIVIATMVGLAPELQQRRRLHDIGDQGALMVLGLVVMVAVSAIIPHAHALGPAPKNEAPRGSPQRGLEGRRACRARRGSGNGLAGRMPD
jgi:hypothetical protein